MRVVCAASGAFACRSRERLTQASVASSLAPATSGSARAHAVRPRAWPGARAGRVSRRIRGRTAGTGSLGRSTQPRGPRPPAARRRRTRRPRPDAGAQAVATGCVVAEARPARKASAKATHPGSRCSGSALNARSTAWSQVAGTARGLPPNRGRLPARLGEDHLDRRSAPERGFPRQHLVHGRRERVQVGGRADGLPERLLRRHVDRRADPGPGLRQLGALRGLERLHDAEVRQEHVPLLVEQDVPRLHVAVHDALRVDVVERLGDAREPREHLLRAWTARVRCDPRANRRRGTAGRRRGSRPPRPAPGCARCPGARGARARRSRVGTGRESPAPRGTGGAAPSPRRDGRGSGPARGRPRPCRPRRGADRRGTCRGASDPGSRRGTARERRARGGPRGRPSREATLPATALREGPSPSPGSWPAPSLAASLRGREPSPARPQGCYADGPSGVRPVPSSPGYRQGLPRYGGAVLPRGRSRAHRRSAADASGHGVHEAAARRARAVEAARTARARNLSRRRWERGSGFAGRQCFECARRLRRTSRRSRATATSAVSSERRTRLRTPCVFTTTMAIHQ